MVSIYFSIDGSSSYDDEIEEVGHARRRKDMDVAQGGQNRKPVGKEENFYQKLHNVLKPILGAAGDAAGPTSRRSRMRRIKREQNEEELLKIMEEQKQKREN